MARAGGHTGTCTPPAVQGEIVIRRARGERKAHIAKALKVSHNTVDAILARTGTDVTVDRLRLKAVTSAEPILDNAIAEAQKPGEGALAMRYLEGIGVMGDNSARVTFNFNDDARLQVALAKLSPAPASPSDIADPPADAAGGATPPAPPTPGAEATEAAAKPDGGDLNVK